MEILQEVTFTAFMAVIFSFAVAKIVSFAVSNSNNGGNTESSTAKEMCFNGELRVRREKGEKRVAIVDDVEVKKIDHFETGNGSYCASSFDRDEDLGLNYGYEIGSSETENSNVGEIDVQDKVCEINEMLIERDCEGDQMDGVCVEKEITYFTGTGKNNLILDEVVLDCEDLVLNPVEENGVVGSRESAVISGGDAGELREREETSVGDDDDWEGIERSELEKVFAEAVNYVEFGVKGQGKDDDRLVKLDSDVKIHLYALHKVALEGPCRDAQPMALMVSSRAKWNAWKKLGSMSQEEAMEKYIKLVSHNLPVWMQGCSAEDDTQDSWMIETTSCSGSHLRNDHPDNKRLRIEKDNTPLLHAVHASGCMNYCHGKVRYLPQRI